MNQKKMILALSASALLLACGGGGGRPTFGDNEYPVTAVEAGSADMQSTYPATISGIQDVEIRPKVSGFLTQINVVEGQTVNAGQLLFVVDNETYQAAVRQAQAAVNTAQAAVNTQKLTYENSKQLFDNKVVGEYELQTAENTYKSALASLAQAQAALASAKENLNFCYVKSPARGVVGTLPFKKGALVSASNVLTHVADISQMEVYFSMTEKDMLALSKAEGGLRGAVDALPAVKLQLADGTVYEHAGKVVTASGVIDQATGSVQLKAQFPNPEHLLKSGGSGTIIIPRQASGAIVIPQSVVMEVQNKKFVYLLGDSNRVVYTEIKVDPQTDGNNYIVTEGLKVGDKYVTNGITKLSDQMQIVPITPQRYQEKIQEQAKAMTAGDIVSSMKKN
ncbi:MAG: efflux RND transporter periplasmic adaptor subunit [Prevotella sp.]|nr:efflux RND transporter periplasmic adaptor subunit [Prevotella sp.]